MGHRLVMIKGMYLEWSTITDSPYTYLMNEEKLREYWELEYGKSSLLDLQKKIDRCKEDQEYTLDTIYFNRAGDNETRLTIDEIYEKYKI